MNTKIPPVELRGDLYWPVDDFNTWWYLSHHSNVPEQIADIVQEKKVVVQAGGNCGMYPKHYATMFDWVYTFEPDWLNFYCLTKNCTEPNIIKAQGCLGHAAALVDLAVQRHSRGKSFIKGEGRYPVYTIDNLALDRCDLIHLDIEGYEYFALLGATQTIIKYKPVIAIEMWDPPPDNYRTRFGENINEKTKQLLSSWGYKYRETINESDWVFTYEQDRI